MKQYKNNAGQALVTLLVFVTIAIVITSGAVAISVIAAQGNSTYAQGTDSYHIAETGIENAVIRLLRDNAYSGETLTVGNGTATITVTGSDTKTINSVGATGNFKRTIEVQGTLSDNQYTITSWKEID